MRWIIRGLLAAIMCFVLGVATFSVAVVLLQHKGVLNRVTTTLFGVDINYQSEHWQWNNGAPKLVITHLMVRGVGQKEAALRVAYIEAKFNLKRSLLSLKPATDMIHISGVNIYVQPSENGLYQLAGITSSPRSRAGSILWGHLWAWLAPQWSVSMDKVQLNMLTDQQKLMQANMVFSWKHTQQGKYQLIFSVQSKKAHKMSARIQATFKGNLLLPNLFSSRFYAQVSGEDVGYFLSAFRLFGMVWKQGQGKVQVWGKWQRGHFGRVHGLFDLQQVYILNHERHFSLSIAKLQQNVLWESQSFTHWRMLATPYHLDKAGKMVMTEQQAIMLARAQNQWQIYLGAMPLHTAMQIVQLLPDIPLTTKLGLIGMQPKATLRHLYADLTLSHQRIVHYVFDGELSKLKTLAWSGYPSTTGLSATWHVTSTWGRATLSGKQVKIGASQWLASPLPAMKTHVYLTWQQTADKHWYVNLQRGLAESKWLTVTGAGGFRFSPSRWKAGHLALRAKITANHFDQAKQYYLPLSHLSPHARAFLNEALFRVPKLSLSLDTNGQLNRFPYQYGDGNVAIAFTIPTLDTHPYPGWPLFKGVAVTGRYKNGHLSLTASNGVAMGVKMGVIHANLSPKTVNKPSVLTIKGQFKTDAAAGERLIANSPLKKRLKQITSLLMFKGPVTQTIDLTIPFEPGHHEQYRGTTTFKNNTVQLIDTPIKLTHFQGKVSFDDLKVWSKNLVAQLWRQPISLVLRSTGEMKHPTSHTLSVQGSIDAYRLQHLFKWPLLRYVEGRTHFTAHYVDKADKAQFSVQSNLKGMSLHLPAPFNKAANDILPLALQVGLSQGSALPASFSLGDLLSGQVLLAHKNRLLHFERGQILIGVSKTPILPKVAGLEINGIVPYMAVKPWVSVIKTLKTHAQARPQKGKQPEMRMPFVRSVNLQLGQLNVYGYDFNQTSLHMSPLNDATWKMKLDGQQVQGSVNVDMADKAQHIQANLTKLILAKDDSSPSTKKSPLEMKQYRHQLSGRQLASLPALNIDVHQLKWEQRDFGTLHWSSRPIEQGIYVDQFDLNNASFSAQLQGHIVTQPKGDFVAIRGKIRGNDWGEAFDTLGYKNLMNKGKGTLNVDLTWGGALMHIDKSTLNGDVDIHLTDGAILAVNPGLIKFLGIIDVGSLFQRLQLTGSHVGDKGLAFTSLKGNYEIRNGVAKTDKMSLSGPSLNLVMKGSVNLATKQLDQTVVVIPHVSGGIALAAGLLGGPVAAAAAWVGEQIIANTVLKNVGIVYQVKGTWEHPKIINKGSNIGQSQP